MDDNMRKEASMLDIKELMFKELQNAISNVVREKMGRYDSPLAKMVDAVVSEHSTEIKDLLREAITASIQRDEFRNEVKSAFIHTLARSLMNDFKGEIEKQANQMRQQPEFRARVVLAIEKIVSELG